MVYPLFEHTVSSLLDMELEGTELHRYGVGRGRNIQTFKLLIRGTRNRKTQTFKSFAQGYAKLLYIEACWLDANFKKALLYI